MPGAGSHALLTRAPLNATPKDDAPFDLHVLGAPPAFVLSQDQTLSLVPRPRKEPKGGTGSRPYGITCQGRPTRAPAIARPPTPQRDSSKATGPEPAPPPVPQRPRPCPSARAPPPGPGPQTRTPPRHLSRMPEPSRPHNRPPPTHPFLPYSPCPKNRPAPAATPSRLDLPANHAL